MALAPYEDRFLVSLLCEIECQTISLQEVEELKSIHTLPSLLLYEGGILVHIVEGIQLVKATIRHHALLHTQYLTLSFCHAAGLPQKRPGRKLASAIRQYLLHERGTSYCFPPAA